MQEIQLIFNPGKGGSSPLSRITAVIGDRVGAMPKPTKKGYIFAGWYMSPSGDPTDPHAQRITAETVLTAQVLGGTVADTTLYALWKKPQSAAETGKRNSLVTQKRAIVALAIVVVVLIGALIAATIISDIYRYTDFDGVTYTIKKTKGEYALFHNGVICDINEENDCYMTLLGTQVELDPETGEYTVFAVVDTEGTEQLSIFGPDQRIMMFKKLTYDASSTTNQSIIIKSFEVHNQHGSFILTRGDNNRFNVKGHDTAILQDTLFAQFANGCASTLTLQRLENPVRLASGAIDYHEYGLAPETRVRLDEEGKELLDEDGKPVTYEYTPTWYTVTTMTDETYTVTLGDATVSGGGYYARYEGRDTVYVLPSANLDAAVLQPVETMVTPLMVFPMTMNTYFQVSNFNYRTDIDHDEVYRQLLIELVDFDIATIKPDEEGEFSEEDKAKIEQVQKDYEAALEAMSDEDFAKLYDRLLKEHSRLVTSFSFIDMASRENTLLSAFPYQMSSEYMAGYLANSDNIGTVLQKLHGMTFEGVTVLGPTPEQLDEYGLEDFTHEFSFIYTDAEGQEYTNYFVVSEKTEDGLYYAYSDNFDMIVCFSESQAEYLEWEEIDWYEREYFQANIAYVQTIKLEGAGVKSPILFTLDNSKSDQTNGTASDKLEVLANGQLIDYMITVTKPSGSQSEEHATYNFRRFFQAFLTASMEGNAELTNEQMEAFRNTPDSECLLKITVCADDGKGNTMYNVYRFYRYTERKAYMTIETLPAPDAPSSPANAQGTFYVLRSFCDKLISDAYRFINAEEITVDSKN